MTPICGTTIPEMRAWADQVVEVAAQALASATPSAEPFVFRTDSRTVALPLEVWNAEEIDQRVADWRAACPGKTPTEKRYLAVLTRWREERRYSLRQAGHDRIEAELMAVRLGSLTLMGVNAEVFTHFTAHLREQTGQDVYTLGCCNGVCGYLPHEAAYDEGGYEPGNSFLFYNTFRIKRGGLEALAEQATDLMKGLDA